MLVGSLNYGTNSFKINVGIRLNSGNLNICKTLYRNGLISSYSVCKKVKVIKVFLSYNYDKQAFSSITLISKPGRKISWSYKYLLKLWQSKFDRRIYILSTSKGYLTSQEAIRYKVGGFVICLLE